MQNSIRIPSLLLACLLTVSLSGCTFIFSKGRRNDTQKISQLKSELSEMERAKAELEDKLKQEIGDKQVTVEMMERGLVITFVAEVLFDSGKDKLRDDALEKLDKVADILKTTVSEHNIGIEGHTDNIPIKYSGWKSNWELSTGRSLSVLHYLVDSEELEPGRLAAIGYGEYRPVSSNDTKEGQQKNRRVEIVILPKTSKEKVAQESGSLENEAENLDREENLK